MRQSSRIAVVAAIASSLLVTASAAIAEGTLRIAEQFGIGYLPLHIMRDQGLIEAKGKVSGVDIKVEWMKLGGGAAMNDALLSGSIDIGAAGLGPVIVAWDKTRGAANIKAIASLGSMPLFLVARRPVTSLKDFTAADKIALPAAVVSVQARTLQIAAEKEFGAGQHGRLDVQTISMAHPDALAALTSGAAEVTAHFSSPPFQYQAMAKGAHKVLSSYDVVGGRQSFNLVFAPERFRKENPKTYAAFLAALKEAVARINADKSAAADAYIRVEKSKLPKTVIDGILADPDVAITMTPERIGAFAGFLHRVGAIKNKPESWKDLFFEDVASLPGS